ncbi:MAG: hypothetical protein ACLTY5_03565 [Angelakisella sp.]
MLLFTDAADGILRGEPGGGARPGDTQRQRDVKALGFYKGPDPVILVHIQPSFSQSGSATE